SGSVRPVRSMATRSRIRGFMCSTSINSIRFYDRDVSAALNIRRIAAGPGRPRELSSWLGRTAMLNPGRPGQEWVLVRVRGRLRKWQRRHQRQRIAWRWQHDQLGSMLQELDENGSIRRDVAVLLQHEPVFTLGTGSTESNLLFDPAASSIPLFRTERGGEVTYHGPGQLVLYPLLHLTQHQQDLHWYLRALEDVVIRALDQVSGLQGERLPGLTGVWVQGKKVAAIGVRAKRWVTYHGLALNVCPDLTPFKQIIPCGITDRPVTSVAELLLLGEEADGQAGGGGSKYGQQGGSLACMRVAEEAALLEEYREALLEAFSHVFDVELSFADDARSSSVKVM
ncbi:hypothetical protein QJQ45_015350, partial [Haematococcus lacustris]